MLINVSPKCDHRESRKERAKFRLFVLGALVGLGSDVAAIVSSVGSWVGSWIS